MTNRAPINWASFETEELRTVLKTNDPNGNYDFWEDGDADPESPDYEPLERRVLLELAYDQDSSGELSDWWYEYSEKRGGLYPRYW